MVRKKETINSPSKVSSYVFSKEKLSKEAEEFIKSLDYPFDLSRIDVQKERVFYIPEQMPYVKGLRILRCGLYMGDMKKNRFEPSQSLAMFLKKEQFPNVFNMLVDDERVIKYLKGETIELNEYEEKNLTRIFFQYGEEKYIVNFL